MKRLYRTVRVHHPDPFNTAHIISIFLIEDVKVFIPPRPTAKGWASAGRMSILR